MSRGHSLSDRVRNFVQCLVKKELIWVVPRAKRELLLTRVNDTVGTPIKERPVTRAKTGAATYCSYTLLSVVVGNI